MKKRLENRLEKLRKQMSAASLDAVVLFGRENTRYLTGFSGSTSMVLITMTRSMVFIDSRYVTQAGQECLTSEILLESGKLAEALADRAFEIGVKSIGLEEDVLPFSYYSELRAVYPSDALHCFAANLAELRWVKDEQELAVVREAVRIADQAFAMTIPEIKVGKRESEIAALLEYNMKRLGAEKASFDTVVASGYRSAMPHGVASDKVIEFGDMVVMDFGAVYQGYCSDMTRSFFVGAASDELTKIYNVVLEAQLQCEAELKAGVKGKEIHQISVDIISSAGYGAYYGHGLGHSLGLKIHEEPRLNAVSETVMQAGVLMTVEPGIYVPDLGGVRIEDTVLIKEGGIEILTASPKNLMVLDCQES